ncbi:UNVERIFIED_CONTAM: hypothetical protein Sradi_0222700 [Sesamum radiatum]|uniref:Purple acid phosphatase N-terminal domain-containing protein n=1 Tax=Sesamum radiatum TaxID=300843 RepID=A0AAW2W0T3_SESRA
MRLRWVSGDQKPQQVQYGNGQKASSSVSTFSQADMCTSSLLESPAVDFGWHDPGYIHSAVMTGLNPSTTYSYKYGSDSVGWSDEVTFRTPPAGGSNQLTFLAYGDMGKAPLDSSVEHYIQDNSWSLCRISEFGYIRTHATKEELTVEVWPNHLIDSGLTEPSSDKNFP